MIVDSMTHEEVYAELAKERDAVTVWWRHQLSSNRRQALKCTRFPLCIWREYTSTRKNHYVFFSRVFDKRMRIILTGTSVTRHTSEGMTVYTTWLNDQLRITPMVLLPHVWKRYAERAKVDKHGADLVKHYFLNNPQGQDSYNQRVVGRSVRWNGEEHLSCCIPDGVLLGQLSGPLYIVRTFITYDMCSGLQKEEFDIKRKTIPTLKEQYDRAQFFYMTGIK